MKKIFALIACMLLLTACDDGELTFNTFNFTGDPQPCDFAENTYITVNENEVLILKFSANDLINSEGEKPVTLSEGNIEYRVYNTTGLNTTNVCGDLDNPNLSVRETWQGSGNLTITTTKSVNSQGMVTYYHSINLVDVSFTQGEKTIRVQDNYLGQIEKPIGFYFDFAEGTEDSNLFLDCNDTKYYFANSDEVILLNIPTASIPTTTGITNPPITLTPPGNTNSIYFTFIKYSSTGLSPEIICTGNVLNPVPQQIWATQSGQLIIDTQSVGGELVHIMYLKNAVFYNTLGNGETFIPVGNTDDPTGGTEDVYYLGRFNPQ